MRSALTQAIRPALVVMAALTLITGLAYPAAVTAVAQIAFPDQANGSLVVVNGTAVGSTLIGQTFTDPKYLWGRPSAAGAGYDGEASGGSNLASTSHKLIDRVTASLAQWQAANGNAPVPVDLVTTSASGLDPDISPAGAAYQVARIAATRGLSPAAVQAIIDRHTSGALLGFLGEPSVNVLLVNLDLDGLLK